MPNATPNVYVPDDRPAIGNMMTLFNFSHPNFGTIKLKAGSEPAGARRRASA